MKCLFARGSLVARILALAVLSGTALTACGSSDDGPMLTDDEKLKLSKSGRESYMKGQQPGAKPETNR